MENMMNLDTMSHEDLQMFILSNKYGLYEMFDESKFLSGRYTHQELIDTTSQWVFEGDETESL